MSLATCISGKIEFVLSFVKGPSNKESSCRTCFGSYNECPGHFGFFHLALPVHNVGHLGTVLDTLKCICKVAVSF